MEVQYQKGRKNDIFWIGESPGGWEEKQGVPFYYKADAGGMFRNCLNEVGLEYDDFFVANAARCRIIKDDLSGKQITEILSCCREYVGRAINLIKPKAIVALGDFALRQILKKSGITKQRGRWVWSEEFKCWVLPTFHPAHILRYMGLRPRLVDDFGMVRDFIGAGYKIPKVSKKRVSGYEEVDDLMPFIKKWEANKETIGIDTEHQGLDWLNPNFVLISFSLSWAEGKAVDVTLYREVGKGEGDFEITWPRRNGKAYQDVRVSIKKAANFKKKMQALARILSSEKIKKYMMNGNSDIHAIEAGFRREGMLMPPINNYRMDIQAAANLVDENLYKMSSLEELQASFTSMKENYKGEFEKKFNKADMISVPEKDRMVYACSDADVTRRVGVSIRKELTRPENIRVARYLANFTMPALGFLELLERNGALIDRKKLPEVTADVYGMMIEAEDRALSVIPTKVLADFDITRAVIREARKGEKFFLTRDELIGEVLFGKNGFGLDGVKQTASKQGWSVAKDVRVILLDRDIPAEARVFIEAYDEFSEDHTTWSRYLRGFEKNIRSDGRVHSSYSLATTVIGRTSSSNPNFQNNPKRSKLAMKIRELICAQPGYVLVVADEAHSELRWAANVSGDEGLVHIFKNSIDPHAVVALDLLRKRDSKWTQDRWDKLSSRQKELERRKAKCVNFGLLYGMSAKGFVRYARKDYGLVLTEAEAQEWKDAWFERFGKIGNYHKWIVQDGLKKGYVESPLGRRRRLPELRSKDSYVRGEAERMAAHHPIASPSSDVVLLAGNEAVKRRPDSKEARPIIFVHDELAFEVKENKAEKWAKILKHEMENPPLERDFDYKPKVPLVAEVKVGENLASLHSL